MHHHIMPGHIMHRPIMRSLALASLALMTTSLAGCGSKHDATSKTAVAAKAAPAGTQWADHVVRTPGNGYRMGNPDAPLKVIEYGSYTCPHCREFEAESHDTIKSKFVNSGKVSYEYRPFVRDPLDITVALLAECEGPERFYPLSLQLFENQEAMIKQIQAVGEDAYKNAMTSPSDQRFVKLGEAAGLISFVQRLGIPKAKAQQCLADGKAADTLAQNVKDATAKYTIAGTPTLILNGSVLENVATWDGLESRLHDAGA